MCSANASSGACSEILSCLPCAARLNRSGMDAVSNSALRWHRHWPRSQLDRRSGYARQLYYALPWSLCQVCSNSRQTRSRKYTAHSTVGRKFLSFQLPHQPLQQTPHPHLIHQPPLDGTLQQAADGDDQGLPVLGEDERESSSLRILRHTHLLSFGSLSCLMI